MITSTLRDRVRAGIEFLDLHPEVPDDWREYVDLDVLDLRNGFRCVLGQLDALYDDESSREPYVVPWARMQERLGLVPEYGSTSLDWMSQRLYRLTSLGFDSADGFDVQAEAGSDPLTAAWREALR